MAKFNDKSTPQGCHSNRALVLLAICENDIALYSELMQITMFQFLLSDAFMKFLSYDD